MMKELIAIQAELKVSKSRVNPSSDFKYRSAEDILEALKPLLTKHNCFLLLSDEMVMVGDRIYVKATATIFNEDSSSRIATTAYAQEPPKPKSKMDESQTTGSASSYARKYALNGLFCIDNGMDPDHTSDIDNIEEKKKALKAGKKQSKPKLV